MINGRDIKLGNLLWWKVDSEVHMAKWSCPAVVTAIKGKKFRITRLDVFKKSGWLSFGYFNSWHEEEKSINTISVCSRKKAQAYIKKREKFFKKEVELAQKEVDTYKKKAKFFLEKHK